MKLFHNQTDIGKMLSISKYTTDANRNISSTYCIWIEYESHTFVKASQPHNMFLHVRLVFILKWGTFWNGDTYLKTLGYISYILCICWLNIEAPFFCVNAVWGLPVEGRRRFSSSNRACKKRDVIQEGYWTFG